MYTTWVEWAESFVPKDIPLREFYKIGEVAELLSVRTYVLRYWETEFSILNPQKTEGNQRLYRRKDLAASFLIKHLLYKEKFSIEGARNKIRNFRTDKEEVNLSEFKSLELDDSPFELSPPKGEVEVTLPKEKINNAIDDLLHSLQSL